MEVFTLHCDSNAIEYFCNLTGSIPVSMKVPRHIIENLGGGGDGFGVWGGRAEWRGYNGSFYEDLLSTLKLHKTPE